jgi:hypothetical protein
MEDNVYRDELEAWAQMWDAAQQDQDFTANEPHQVIQQQMEDDVLDNDSQSLYARMFGMEPAFGPEVSEPSIPDTGETLLQEEQGRKTPNPVYPDSVGMDQQNPKPAWVKEDLLKELEEMKAKLFDMENKMAELGASKDVSPEPVLMKNEEIPAKIVNLRKEIDKISDQLGIKDEPSPWKVEEQK